jgi:hypothetical protein
MAKIDRLASVVRDLTAIISSGSQYDTRFAANSGPLLRLQSDIESLASGNSDVEDDTSSLLKMFADPVACQQRIAEYSESHSAHRAMRDEALAALNDLQSKSDAQAKQLADERAAHDEKLAHERGSHEAAIQAHALKMTREAIESSRLVDQARADAAAAAELKASIELRHDRVMKAMQQ